MAVRPHIRKISADSLVADLASGELCLIIASGGDAMQAQERLRSSGSRAQIGYAVPREGAVMWFDVAAIPADAPHPDDAYRFINFLMDAEVAAENTNAIRFPNGNLASQPRVPPELSNAAGFPQGAAAARLISEAPRSEPYVRARTRVWTHFRTGQ
jgi:putrescine transport system substrate-binding protein